MVNLQKNIQWWWSGGSKTIEKPSLAMVPWKKTLPSHCLKKMTIVEVYLHMNGWEWIKMWRNGWKWIKKRIEKLRNVDENALPNNTADFVKNVKLVKILTFSQNSDIWVKFWNLVEILKFAWSSEIFLKIWKSCKKSEIWLIFLHLVKILKFGWFPEIWFEFWNLVDFLKFGSFPEIWLRFWNLIDSEIWLKILKIG